MTDFITCWVFCARDKHSGNAPHDIMSPDGYVARRHPGVCEMRGVQNVTATILESSHERCLTCGLPITITFGTQHDIHIDAEGHRSSFDRP